MYVRYLILVLISIGNEKMKPEVLGAGEFEILQCASKHHLKLCNARSEEIRS